MAGFEESDLYAAFGLEQPAGGNEPGAAEPGAQEGQARGTEPGTGEAQEPAQTQEQDPSRDQGDGGAQGGAGGARDVSVASQAEGGQEGEPAQQTKEQPPQGGRGIRNEAEPQTAAQRAENAARRRREEQQAAIDAAVKMAVEDERARTKGQMEAFKDILIHDITPKEFADVYAQTIVYGMFAARLHDTTPDTFSRHEAATLIPKTNPFLRQLFQNVAGYDLDDRISWIVDDSAEIFRAADMRQVMAGFGHRTQQTDPMIHFYEDFLAAYDPKQRKNRGVWYTPQAVVSCIVKTVDEILQAEFNLPMGLADTSKITVERSIDQSKDKRFSDGKKKETVKIHKVQLLHCSAYLFPSSEVCSAWYTA